jgi:Fe-S cluster assembly protein SufD
VTPSDLGSRISDLLERNSPRGNPPPWLADLRLAGAMRLAAVGIPGSRDEEWRFTPVGPIAQVDWRAPSDSPSLDAAALAPFIFDASWPTVVLVDGRYDATLSRLDGLPKGVTVQPLATAIAAGTPGVMEHLGRTADAMQTPFTALSAATFEDGLFLHVSADVSMPMPVHLLHIATDASADALLAPRGLVVIDAGARASLVESYVSLTDKAHFTNTVIEVVMGANAWLEHTRVQRENESAWHIGFTQVDQARDSHYRSFALAMGGRLARHNIHTRLNDSNIETLLYGLYLTRGSQLADTHSAIFHDHPHCNSWEVYKGVLADKSRAVFNGKVFVQPIAQKTDAKQTNRNLLLSDQAKVDTKPQLEIFADDVKCTHGATVGKLNEQQRYYLRSRGIGGKKAEQLLIWAFAAEVLAEVAQRPVREELERLVHARLDELTA